jgi:hypothetical protein
MRNYLAAMNVFFLQYVSTSALLLLIVGCATGSAPQSTKLSLSGAQEVPPVVTTATGGGQITVLSNRAVSGSATTSGIAGTSAHIHEASPGKNGPVAIPLTKASDGTWTVPAGAKLTEAQYASYLAGNLYVNVHSAAHPAGEIRGQITPPGGVRAQATSTQPSESPKSAPPPESRY